ncbi:zinc ribbon domain-containing protein [Paraflavitalea speifideaquila]|uniref:zinc ribbon domain-containing protein n=1 Tax=Paraflavitalea speifideaquila TaxID=3076558 RepID=UPI003312FF89
MQCPKCGRNLTGSASKGKGGRYFYYHCISPCGNRLKAEDANDKFIKKLAIAVKEEHITLFEHVMRDHYHKSNKDNSKVASELKAEIEKNRERIAKAQQLMVDGELPAADYREIKIRYEAAIQRQERELNSLSQVDNNLLEYAEAAADILRNLPMYFSTASLPVQQKIVSSIYAEKLIIDEKECRTPKYNDVIEWISTLGAASGEIKKQASKFGSLSDWVTPWDSNPGPTD